jgi:hypothetical protein
MPLDLHGAGRGVLPLCAGSIVARHLAGTLALLAVLSCGSDGGDSTGPIDDGDNDALPAELVGTWRFQQAGDVICDPATGLCTSSYARSETLRFSGDGEFEHALFAESNFPGCSLVVQHESHGTAAVQGSSLSLHIEEGLTRVEDTCGESSDTDESGETDVYTWSLSEGPGGVAQLTLTDAEDNEIGPFEPASVGAVRP